MSSTILFRKILKIIIFEGVSEFITVVKKEKISDKNKPENCTFDQFLYLIKMGPNYDLGEMTYKSVSRQQDQNNIDDKTE